METKLCNGPGHDQPTEVLVNRFYKNRHHSDGLNNWCKDCITFYRAKHRVKVENQLVICHYCKTKFLDWKACLNHNLEVHSDKEPLIFVNDGVVSFKKCSGPTHKGGQLLPATTYFWHRNNSSSDGFNTRCKECIWAYSKACGTGKKGKKIKAGTAYYICALKKGEFEILVQFDDNRILQDARDHVTQYSAWFYGMPQELWICRKRKDGKNDWKRVEKIKDNTSRELFREWIEENKI